jgi:hypothetical protein
MPVVYEVHELLLFGCPERQNTMQVWLKSKLKLTCTTHLLNSYNPNFLCLTAQCYIANKIRKVLDW